MAANRKLQGEIDKTLKKVQEVRLQSSIFPPRLLRTTLS